MPSPLGRIHAFEAMGDLKTLLTRQGARPSLYLGDYGTMESILRLAIKAREYGVGRLRGQTMTEYAMVVFAIAIAAFAAYQVMGNDLSSTTSGIGSMVAGA